MNDNDFIDNIEIEESLEDHYAFTNVNRNYADAVYDSFSDFDFDQEPKNYCNVNEVCNLPVDEFKDNKQKIDLFIDTLINPQGSNNKDSFFYSILYTVRYFLTQKIEPCTNEDELRLNVTAEIFDEIYPLKENVRLDLDILNFEKQCFQIKYILNISNFFLRIFELKEKIRCLIKQDAGRKNLIRELSSCIFEKFNGFKIVRLEFDRKLRQKMSPIDIIYKPVKAKTENIECFFSKRINMACRTTFNENEKIRHETAFQCYFCSNYYERKDKFDRHFKNCTGRPGYVYNFNTQNLFTFEENLKFKHGIPLTAYIDFETTAPTNDCLDPENKKMTAVSYVIIFAF